jgi:activating signal cointegrator complex subunit 2
VDAADQEADGVSGQTEEVLFRAWQMDVKAFDRDAATRRGQARTNLRNETGMADEAIEGWAVMLARNPQQQRKLQAKYAFSGQQEQIERTSWRPSGPGSGAEDSDRDGAGNNARGGGRGGRGRGRGGGGRGRGRGGNVAGPTGEKGTESARRNKEANKGSRANHNRRDARAKKLARGGFAG